MRGLKSKRSTISRFLATCMAVAALASFAACKGGSSSPDGSRVYGVVYNNDVVVSGVLVSSSEGASTRSSDNGFYELYLRPGNHVLEFSKEGMISFTKAVTVDGPEMNVDADFARSGDSFTCAPGVQVEYTVNGPGVLEFDVQGAYIGDAKEHLVWAYEPHDYWRGGVSGGGSQWGIRTNKIKSYGIGGREPKEPRYSFPWDPSKTHHVSIYWDSTKIAMTVDYWYQASVSGNFPTIFNVGIGWPTYRPGLTGARYSNIKWPAGALLKMKTF